MSELIKFRIENFASYGLNKYRNFLATPECDCGCSNDHTRLLLNNQEELFDFMANMLFEHGCPDGAIFAIGYDNKMYAAVMNDEALMPTKSEAIEIADENGIVLTNEDFRDDDEEIDSVYFFGTEDIEMDFFSEIDANFRCCCYGLIIETKPGEWKIIND